MTKREQQLIQELTQALKAATIRQEYITQRKAKAIYGVTWLNEKLRDSERCGVRLWVRTGGAPNSPKKYNTRMLDEILDWERVNGLPYNFKDYGKRERTKEAV